MKKKQGLTIEQHRSIGAQLKETTGDLQRLVVDLNVYPKSSRSVVLSKKTEGLLWELRSELEASMSREDHGDPPDLNIYYGGKVDD